MTFLDKLKRANIWLNWNYKEVDGKTTKVPSSFNGKKIGASDSFQQDWCDYETAKVQVDDYTASGIGIVLLRFTDIKKSLVAIDIDHRNKDDPYVKDIVSFMNTYTEISPSGNGFHLLFLIDSNKIPPDYKIKYFSKHPKTKIECYVGGIDTRYMTFTGNVFVDKDVEERTEEFMYFINSYMRQDTDLSNIEEHIKESVVNSNVPTNNQAIINIIKNSKQWEKFAKLFNEGDISDYNGDYSSADMALATIIAFYVGDNVERIEVMMKQSALYRDKYERKDYLKNTIKKAIALHNGNFFNWNDVPAEEQEAQKFNSINIQSARELQENDIEEPTPIVEGMLYPRNCNNSWISKDRKKLVVF